MLEMLDTVCVVICFQFLVRVTVFLFDILKAETLLFLGPWR